MNKIFFEPLKKLWPFRVERRKRFLVFWLENSQNLTFAAVDEVGSRAAFWNETRLNSFADCVLCFAEDKLKLVIDFFSVLQR